ncbi:hypothetical protein FQN54_009800 [Arachnomyces sp. PD_36]|nr:hypothetical protein FQN54_009800 [Arachnomyces sp. PD_36]
MSTTSKPHATLPPPIQHSQCYSICGEALREIQAAGRSKLCGLDSDASLALSYCGACVEGLDYSDRVSEGYRIFIKSWAAFCNSTDLEELSSAIDVASAHGYTLVPTSTLNTTAATTSTLEPSVTSDESDTSALAGSAVANNNASDTPDRSWIAGAVVAPIAALILIAVGVPLYMRWKRKQKAGTDDTVGPIGFEAQLHGESFDPKELCNAGEASRHNEADSINHGNQSYELSANEPPATEVENDSRA